MTTVTLRASGRAPADLAWERYADPALWSTWSPQIQRVDLDAPRLVTGATGTVRAGLLPRPTVGIPFTVLSVDEAAMTWAWEVRLGPLPGLPGCTWSTASRPPPTARPPGWWCGARCPSWRRTPRWHGWR